MGKISEAFDKSKVKVSDISEYKSHYSNAEPETDLIQDDKASLIHDHKIFPEEYIIKSEIVMFFGNKGNLPTET